MINARAENISTKSHHMVNGLMMGGWMDEWILHNTTHHNSNRCCLCRSLLFISVSGIHSSLDRLHVQDNVCHVPGLHRNGDPVDHPRGGRCLHGIKGIYIVSRHSSPFPTTLATVNRPHLSSETEIYCFNLMALLCLLCSRRYRPCSTSSSPGLR